MSNKFGRKDRQRAADKLFKKKENPFRPVKKEEVSHWPPNASKAFINERYVVTVFENERMSVGTATKVLVQRHDDRPIDKHWSELQRIKNELFGEETTAIEIFPPQSELVDLHNIYWLFIFPDGVIPKIVEP